MNTRICILISLAFLSHYFLFFTSKAALYKRCSRRAKLVLKGSPNGKCIGCLELVNCSTWDGSIQLRGYRLQRQSEEMNKELHFPHLREITGHLLITLLYDHQSLKGIFPNLSVIRGRTSLLFLDYALVIYQNSGLKEVNLPSLNVILGGGVRIEKNINLCYVNTVRWKSIMKASGNDKYAIVTSSNNNDCYDMCYKDQCYPPAGHGVSGKQYCWSPGASGVYSCQKLCNTNCIGGCVDGSQEVCCHSECLGGCTQVNSEKHCHACRHFRLQDGTCSKNCPSGFFEYEDSFCVDSCNYPASLKYNGKCVRSCPAGYKESSMRDRECVKCQNSTCPKICRVEKPISLLSSLANLKDCTVIDGNLVLKIKGGAGKIASILEENLGKIEEVWGYVLVRESSALISLNFLRNLKSIKPKSLFLGNGVILYNEKYALAILDNAKLENLWPFEGSQLTIEKGGIMVHLNPRLCPKDINPLIEDVLKWNQTQLSDSERPLDISKANGNQKACNIQKINVTVEATAPGFFCGSICLEVRWKEAVIKSDYRNVLLYTVSYREAPHENITEYDDLNSCESSNSDVWKRFDVPPNKPKLVNSSLAGQRPSQMSRKIGKLKPFTLYAFFVEAYVLQDDGAKSDLIFYKTAEAIPSAPVGVEASFLSDSSILVKWQTPLFPNGKITKYIIYYERSKYSVWKQNFNWCDRQLTFNNEDSDSKHKGDPGNGIDKGGNCLVNITCDCDKDKKEVVKPEKQAALFAKEFQDQFFKKIFIKKNDDDDDHDVDVNTTTSTAPHTTVSAVVTTANCSSTSQDCKEMSTESATTKAPTTIRTNFTSEPRKDILSTTPSPRVKVEVANDKLQYTMEGLHHFSDYTIMVCACTRIGCTRESQCYNTKGRTGKKDSADNLPEPLRVIVDNNTRSFNLSWTAPPDPNVIILKYDVKITHLSEEKSRSSAPFCFGGDRQTWYSETAALSGNYSAQVRAITPAGNGSWSEPVAFTLPSREPQSGGGNDKRKAVDVGAVAGVSVTACIVFVLIGGLAVWYITRKRYRERQIPGVLYASVNPEYMNSSDVYIADEWEVPREKIKLIRELGNGSFGMVYEGEAIDIVPGQPRCRVAVKTVSENASSRDRIEFLHEASIMKAFNCNHVVRLLGVVSDGQPTLVIMELMELGDLKNFLRSRRPEEGSLPPPSLREMLQMAAEIADGMAYLACRKFVHRDLAARNCMVTGDFVVKIGDFGMTRDIYETDYYRKGGKGLLPVRWMAPESLKDGVFTSATDVWSYAVVLWEMTTLACQPYPGKSNEEVLKYVVDGGIVDRPVDCPDKLYDLMTLCWQYNPKLRPTFLHLVELLENDVSEAFKQRSYYHSLTSDQLNDLAQAQTKGHHKSRHKTETVESHA